MSRGILQWASFGKRSLVGLALLLTTFALQQTGRLDFIETQLSKAQFEVVRTTPTSQIVIVAIDAHSLQSRPVWPWPRSWHAQMIDYLLDAGVAQIAIDIDFSAESTPSEDSALTAALSRGGERVILPVFEQLAQTQAGGMLSSAPLSKFMSHTRIGSANLRGDRDGIVRSMQRYEGWAGKLVPTLPVAIAGPAEGLTEAFLIDFGINADTFTVVSYVDVLAGKVDPKMFVGKIVLIGATALELGDIIVTPTNQLSPGVVVQALATASILQGRALERPAPAVTLALMIALYILAEAVSRRQRWTGVVFLCLCAMTAVFIGSVAVQKSFAVSVSTAPLIVISMLACLASLIGRIQELDVRVLSSALALHRSNSLMRRVVDDMFDGLLILDADGIVKSANPAVERILQRNLSEILDRPIATFIAGLKKPNAVSWLDYISKQHQTHEVEVLPSNGNPTTAEVAVTRRLDEPAAAFVVLVRDISDRKAASAAVARHQARLKDAIECVAGSFILFDSEERLLACNQNFRNLYPTVGDLIVGGSRAADLFRNQISAANPEMTDPEVSALLNERLTAFRNASKPFEIKTEGERWLLVDERRTSEGGIVGIHTDITEVKRHQAEMKAAKELAEAANRSKSQFLANMSHELRTPLNAVIGFSEVMGKEMLGPIGTEAYRGYVSNIHDSANHLLSIINDILDISSIESGAPRLREEIVSPKQVCESIANLMADRMDRAGISLECFAGGAKGQLWADSRMVKQMLINLVSNAVKFSSPGSRVQLHVTETEDRAIIFTVSDQGIGIAAKDLARILKPFEQVESAFERCHDGVGLGLSLVQSMANLHEATLDINSALGEGTTVILRFPPARYRSSTSNVTRFDEHRVAKLA